MSLVPYFDDDGYWYGYGPGVPHHHHRYGGGHGWPVHRHHPRYHHPMSTAFGSVFDDLGDLMNAALSAPTGRLYGATSGARVQNKSDKFEVSMDVKGFEPTELKVKVQDRVITVHGSHEDKEDEHGFISREFTRRYVVPEGIKMELVTSKITPDGVLHITAPKIHAIDASKEMEIEIQAAPAIAPTAGAKPAAT